MTPLVEAFRALCFARALLYANGWLYLHEAVDELQAFAKSCGLVAAIGQDAVQATMALFFDPIRDPEPSTEQSRFPKNRKTTTDDSTPADQEDSAGAIARQWEADDAKCPPAPSTPDQEPTADLRGVASSTLDAVTYLLQQGDGERLQSFLGKHTAAERNAIRQHLQKAESHAKARAPANAA